MPSLAREWLALYAEPDSTVAAVEVGSSAEGNDDEAELALRPMRRRRGQNLGPSLQPHFNRDEWLSPIGPFNS